MAGMGTGCPLTLRCTRCKVMHRGDMYPDVGIRLEATGRIRALTSGQDGHGTPRTLQYRIEFRCLDCGHVGWTRHSDAERLLARVTAKAGTAVTVGRKPFKTKRDWE